VEQLFIKNKPKTSSASFTRILSSIISTMSLPKNNFYIEYFLLWFYIIFFLYIQCGGSGQPHYKPLKKKRKKPTGKGHRGE
jgi:hypothetical protein